MRARWAIGLVLAGLGISACSVYPVAQDPEGLSLRRDANRVMMALEAWHKERGTFPRDLNELVPRYLPRLPEEPRLQYHPNDGSLAFRYVPSWPQLRPVWCASVGDTTNWVCSEHLLLS